MLEDKYKIDKFKQLKQKKSYKMSLDSAFAQCKQIKSQYRY